MWLNVGDSIKLQNSRRLALDWFSYRFGILCPYLNPRNFHENWESPMCRTGSLWLEEIDHGSFVLKISENYPVRWVTLKLRLIEINCELESNFINWKFYHVMISFRNVDSPFEEFLTSLGFLWKIGSDGSENKKKFGLVNLNGFWPPVRTTWWKEVVWAFSLKKLDVNQRDLFKN